MNIVLTTEEMKTAEEFWENYPAPRDCTYFLTEHGDIDIEKVFEFAEEYASQPPTLSKEKVMEILELFSNKVIKTVVSGSGNVDMISEFADTICNLPPAVSKQPYGDSKISENDKHEILLGLQKKLAAKGYLQTLDPEFNSIVQNYFWDLLSDLLPIKTTSEQPDVSENDSRKAFETMWNECHFDEKIVNEDHWITWQNAIEWLQSLQPAKEEAQQRYEKACNLQGDVSTPKAFSIFHNNQLRIAAGLPPTPEEKGGEG